MTGPLRVLIVEDSPLISLRLATMVEGVPFAALHGIVETEAGACGELARGHVDVAIIDLDLRQGSGIGVVRYMRGLPAEPTSIVFTNNTLPPYRAALFALGASHFMDKSRDFDNLAALLGTLAMEKARPAS